MSMFTIPELAEQMEFRFRLIEGNPSPHYKTLGLCQLVLEDYLSIKQGRPEPVIDSVLVYFPNRHRHRRRDRISQTHTADTVIPSGPAMHQSADSATSTEDLDCRHGEGLAGFFQRWTSCRNHYGPAIDLDWDPYHLSSSPTLLSQDSATLQKLCIRFAAAPGFPTGTELCITFEDLRSSSGTIPNVNYPQSQWLNEFLRRCSNLEGLQELFTAGIPARTSVLKTGLYNLDSIAIGEYIDDEDLAPMLSALSYRQWRSISLVEAGPLTVEPAMTHCSMLEALELTLASGITIKHMHQTLTISPRLQSLITLAADHQVFTWTGEEIHIMADDFIDEDPSTSSLKPWACESTLKMFRAKVSGIPRPDITRTFHGRAIENKARLIQQEAYPGQSQELQQRVYGRLGRLTRLEQLELGNEDRNFYDEHHDYSASKTEDDKDAQYTCLEMNLTSGLQMLGGLKNLGMLSVERMMTRIGINEVQWMKQAWPRLEAIRGLDVSDERKAMAEKW
ncbi:hypothetical protein BGW39_009598 [Mortierella sp. 14UC]|nr:hypothetical protein BGW39_009598 [Mortierella sp. 14UC]